MVRAAFALSTIMINLAISGPALAGEYGSREEAIGMVRRVQEKFQREGSEATFRAVTGKARIFHDRDLYPFIYDLNGVVVAHGAKADLVGKNLIDFKDQDGKFVIRKMIDVVNGPGNGWVDLRWMNPLTHEVEAKSSYVEKMGQYWAGVGVYIYGQVNDNTVGIISGSPHSDDTYLQMAYDLADVLNGSRLRILPIAGIGGPQNIRDVRFLKGVDIGLTQTNILNSFRRSNELLGKSENKVVYITKLFNEEAHLVAGPGITSIEQLKGRKVNLDQIGSGTSYTARDILKRLDIQVEETSVSQTEALQRVKNGTIAATVLIAGKPARSMQRISAQDGLHFLPIPYSSALVDDYVPASLTHEDYPDVIAPGQTVESVAAGAVLISFNWPKDSDRYRRVQRFVESLFPRISEFHQPLLHPKWREVNLAATLPGWDRFRPAEEWLQSHKDQIPRPAVASDPSSTPGVVVIPASERHLYEQFLEWKRAKDPVISGTR